MYVHRPHFALGLYIMTVDACDRRLVTYFARQGH